MQQPLYGWGLPVDISTHGHHMDALFWFVHWFMLVLFVGWGSFMAYTVWRFRERPGHQAAYQLEHFKMPSYLEVGVAILEMVLLFGFSVPVMINLKERFPRPEKSMQVRVVAEQFTWNVHYTGPDGKFGKVDAKLVDDTTNPLGRDPKDAAGKDDITSVNQLHIPVDQPVTVHITSKDVIHSFSLPVMRVKQDAIPGESIPIWFEAKQTGEFQIACAQLCGDNHFKMVGKFVVQPKAEFDKWLAEQAQSSGIAAPAKEEKEEKEEFE
jgi:cytochrome c oxidase subunit 2